MYTLGIESSCDETAAAVLRGERELLSNVVYSQIKLHRPYGGVVPEVASRDHLQKLPGVIEQSLQQAQVSLRQIELIGVTYGPGLMGCLLVGLSYAKALAYGLKKPFIGVNHLEGHLFAHYLEHPEAPPPFIALLVSGGHTALIYVKTYGDYELLGQTRDDAAGEAFDKVGKLLGLPYPAGAEIDKLAREGNAQAVAFPRPMLASGNYQFSFSGLKTALVLYLRAHPKQELRADVAASFQEALIDVLVKKTLRAAQDKGVRQVVVVGGVAANSRLRRRLLQAGQQSEVAVSFPSPALCGDNAAMIAAAAYFNYRQGRRS
ncbi:MAG TPA: tRNA (adenosine(37)-N6)-threonylcarbamoyltransferase complex transferase subunit TsaD, partial [Candidatus Fraserbacteria bacterium]|nr:tRNA (adenosine(37)-N6)-threonylcarbamoyltransferase complex transferase subunit TsaD [Candidatus Fraserbacteria bacterium]